MSMAVPYFKQICITVANKKKFCLLSSAVGLTKLLTDSLGVTREQEGDTEIDTWQKWLWTMEMAPRMQAVFLAAFMDLCP